MAIEMLVEETRNRIPHAYYHDLESVFYSLCWLCTSQEGPYSTPRDTKFKFNTSELAKWNGVGLNNPTLDEIRRFKESTVLSDSNFSMRILGQFAPYFAPLKPVVAELRRVMISEGSNSDYLTPVYRKQLNKRKEAMARARENGEPVDQYMLTSIPNSERDHRDVFQSLYEIIDSFIEDLKEPELPPGCRKPTNEAVVAVKPTREHIDDIGPKGVRELVDGNAEARAYRAKAMAEAKIREMDQKTASGYPQCSGVLFRGHLQPESSVILDYGEDEDIRSVWDESDVPPSIADQRKESTHDLPPLNKSISHPGDGSFSTAPQQSKSFELNLPVASASTSSLLPSPVINKKRQPRRTNKSAGNSNMPPPRLPRHAKQRNSNERSRAPTPIRHNTSPTSPPPTSLWSMSSKRSASEFEADEPGQRTPTQASPPKKQRLG